MCIHTLARLSTTFSIQAHSIANSIVNPRLSDNLYFELLTRISTDQAFIQPNPIEFQQEFAVPDGLSVPANLRLVIVPLIHSINSSIRCPISCARTFTLSISTDWSMPSFSRYAAALRYA